MKKKIPKHTPAKKTPVKIQFPDNKNILFYVTLGLSFLVNFVIYILTLAPTVTFEDSGELITAAYTLGVPHQPGYPLFTMIGKIFTLIPVENIAFRVNMMSAFFSSAAALFICRATIIILEDTFIKTKFWKSLTGNSADIMRYSIGLGVGLLFGSSYENWEQSLITEVYGLNTFFFSLFVLLAVLWKRQNTVKEKSSYFYLICLFIGLALSNHSTSLMLIPVLFIYILVIDRKFLFNIKTLPKGTLFGILGLLPYLYLPVASARNPIMDWGNPENWTNFTRTIVRHQYIGDTDTQTFDKFSAEFSIFFDLLKEQWFPILLVFAVIALFILFKHNRHFFYFAMAFLLLSIPVTVYITGNDTYKTEEYRMLVSVVYIPAYLLLSVLTGVGIFYLISIIKSVPVVLSFILICFGIGNYIRNYKKVDMSNYYFAQHYVENLFNVATKNSVVFANWDPYYFPLNYYQYVEKKRPDITVIDPNLLKRSWYIEWMNQHYREIVKPSKAAVDEFLKAVEPFENKKPYDGNYIQQKYIGMINSLVDNAVNNGKNVYFTYNLPNDILRNYQLESVLTAYRLVKTGDTLTPVKYDDLYVEDYTNKAINTDRMARLFKNSYGELILSRAMLMESTNHINESLFLYKKSLLFIMGNNQMKQQIESKIYQLSQTTR